MTYFTELKDAAEWENIEGSLRSATSIPRLLVLIVELSRFAEVFFGLDTCPFAGRAVVSTARQVSRRRVRLPGLSVGRVYPAATA